MNSPLFIKKDGRLIRVMPKDVVCIEADRAYSVIYAEGLVEPIRLSHSMGSMLGLFPDGLLTVVGRSLAVNINHIREVGDCSLLMDGNQRFTIGVEAMKNLRNGLKIIG